MKLHLTEGEIWTLRYIDLTSEHGCRQTNLGGGKWAPDLPPNLVGAKEPPVSAGEAVRHAHALEDYGLVEVLTWHSGGGEFRISGAGREWLWEHVHPDIVEKTIEWARHHPGLAPWIIGYTLSGAAIGWIALILSVLAMIMALCRP